ncbi:zinc-ribbon domain containing protein [bacterium]|nr:zinc-ribbon domain containing protein [bacterium]
MYQDKQLVCADCGAEFVFTAGEQEFHASKGFTSEPRRCPACRAKRKSANAAVRPEGTENLVSRPPRPMFDAVCAECGKSTKVPFQPTGSRPVYCSDCYHSKGAGSSRSVDGSRSFGASSPRSASGGGSAKSAGGRSFGGGRSFEGRSSGSREGGFDSFDFSDYGGDPFGSAPSSGRGNRKRNNKRENAKERSRKEGGGRPRGRFFDDDDDEEMYF